jgi:hypothetical protein
MGLACKGAGAFAEELGVRYVADRLGLVVLDLRSGSQYTFAVQLSMNIAAKSVRH